jgi:hypothetical protein
MDNWDVERTASKQVLLRHFPDISQIELWGFGDLLGFCAYVVSKKDVGAKKHERMLGTIAMIARTVDHLQKARKELLDISPEGRIIFASAVLGDENYDDHFSHHPQDEIDIIVDSRISGFDKIIAEYEHARMLLQAAGEWKSLGRGQPKKDGPRMLAKHCGMIFKVVSGKKPTVTTDPISFIDSGPFLAFVVDVFQQFEISASPQAAARETVKIFKEENR